MFCPRKCRAGIVRERWAIGVSAAGSSQSPARIPVRTMRRRNLCRTRGRQRYRRVGRPFPGFPGPGPIRETTPPYRFVGRPAAILAAGRLVLRVVTGRATGSTGRLTRSPCPVPPDVIPPRAGGDGLGRVRSQQGPLGGCRWIRLKVIRHFADGTVRRPTSGNFSSREGATTRSAVNVTFGQRAWRGPRILARLGVKLFPPSGATSLSRWGRAVRALLEVSAELPCRRRLHIFQLSLA
jgi:hypothetical protein